MGIITTCVNDITDVNDISFFSFLLLKNLIINYVNVIELYLATSQLETLKCKTLFVWYVLYSTFHWSCYNVPFLFIRLRNTTSVCYLNAKNLVHNS